MQEEQVEYLENSEVDFSSDDNGDEDDMEDFSGRDEGRRSAGHLGKRPSGMVSLLLMCTDTADFTDCAIGVIADGGNCMQDILVKQLAPVPPNDMQDILCLACSCCQQQL